MDNISRLYQEAYRLSEERLQAQTSAAFAADSRAMSFAGLIIAAAAILCGLAKDSAEPMAMIVGAILLTISGGFAGYSARPIEFFMPGSQFGFQQEDFEKDVPYDKMIAELGSFNDKHIKHNEKMLSLNAKLLRTAFLFAIFGLVLAILPNARAYF